MGLVLGIEAAVGTAEAAEVATVATEESITGVTEATEIIDRSASAGLEAGTKAGSEASAAASEGEGALSKILDLLRKAVPKVIKMVNEFVLIDTVFKVAKSILEGASSDPITQHRAERLSKLIYVLNSCSTIMKNLSDWLEQNGEDTTNIGDITVTMRGVLSQFLPSLASAAVVLQKLSSQVAKENDANKQMTEEEGTAAEISLSKILGSLKSLADFKTLHENKVQLLKKLPIDAEEVLQLQLQMA